MTSLGFTDASMAHSVSVIIPAYNRARTIRQTIESALTQTSQVEEIIVVDDGSTDNTREIVECFKDPRVKLLRNPTNLGAPGSRNRGADAATGEWLSFLDSDDAWCDGKVSAERELVIRHQGNVDVIATNHVDVVDGVPMAYSTMKHHVLEPIKRLYVENYLGTCSSFSIRRGFFKTIGGFNPDLRSCQDWDIWLRAVSNGRFAVSVPANVLYTLSSGNNISFDGRRRRSGHVYMWREHIRPAANDKVARAALAITFADIAFNLGRKKSFRRLCRYAFLLNIKHGVLAAVMLKSSMGDPTYENYRARVLRALGQLRSLRKFVRVFLPFRRLY